MGQIEEYKRVFYAPGEMHQCGKHYQVEDDLDITRGLRPFNHLTDFACLQTACLAHKYQVITSDNGTDDVDRQSGEADMENPGRDESGRDNHENDKPSHVDIHPEAQH